LAILRVAAEVTGVSLGVSNVADESDVDFAARIAGAPIRPDRVRLLGPLAHDARRHLHRHDIAIDVAEPVADAMIELQRWVREQAISRTMHRHGRLIARSGTDRGAGDARSLTLASQTPDTGRQGR
jgi:RHH-type proline utilization regulon transcriptional repressor/proline dehydrogenase/delta 1-pyrroline-5-carboxylate dehydrogenase